MKIIKYQGKFGQIFDTDNIETIVILKSEVEDIMPLHHMNKPTTDYDYLKQYFPPNHNVFDDFGNSYYYVQRFCPELC